MIKAMHGIKNSTRFPFWEGEYSEKILSTPWVSILP
jgi:hypothetical protein